VKSLVAGLVIAATLIGCRGGPDYRPPAPPAGATASWSSLDVSAETSAAPRDDWWRLYQDPRLDELLAEAFKANTDLAAAEANLSGARAVLAAARAGRYPNSRVTTGGIYGRDAATDEILELGGHAPQTVWILDDLLEVSYEVDLFGRVRRSVEASRAGSEAAVAARDSLRVVIAAETTRAYADVCALGTQLEVANRSLRLVSHEADITVSRHAAGANSQFDVVRAQGLVAQIRSAIAPLEGQRRAALFQLAAVLGRTPASAPLDLETCVTAPHLSALIPAGDGAELLKRRPDVRQAERALAAATARIGVATADLYPTIRLSGLYGGVATQVSALGTAEGLTWGVGPSISWSFPNQSIPRARIKQAEAAAAAALAVFDSTVLTALKETEQSLALYAAALQGRDALVDAQTRAHQAYDMARNELLVGAVSNLDLLTAEQTVVAADAAIAAADTGIVRAQIAVFKALGGGWRETAN
jgi:NodT family efflux transporter outer membrane factor (OMF) lipoprotein